MANQSSKTLIILKQHTRQRLKKIRQEIDISRRIHASTQACKLLLQKIQAARWVLSFASFGSEIDLWPLNQDLMSQGRLVLPCILEGKLRLFRITYPNQLKIHPWGILEPCPSTCEPIDLSLIAIALIPSLGFDLKTKHRLGYGKGYYDRLLSTSSTQTWGVGFLEQVVENLPYDNYDIPLTHIFKF